MKSVKEKVTETSSPSVSNVDTGNLLEVIDSHKQEEIIEVLKQQPLEIRMQVREVSVDMLAGFAKVIAEVFPKATSGVMEGINNKAKLIMRQGYGFTDFDNFRERLLASFSD